MNLWKSFHNATLTGITNVKNTFKLGGTEVTATAAELNALDGITATVSELNIMSGVTATAAELNRSTDISARIVTTTATALSLTVTQHAERVVLINTNSTVANTFTLPAASGSGAKFTLINGIAQTQGSIVVAANGTDVMKGGVIIADTTAETAAGFLTSATSDKYTFNLTTMGGLGADKVEAWDVAANTWQVQITAFGSGTLATGFAAT